MLQIEGGLLGGGTEGERTGSSAESVGMCEPVLLEMTVYIYV